MSKDTRDIVERLAIRRTLSNEDAERDDAADEITRLRAERDAAVEAGVVAAMENLRDIAGRGTDKQAYDHVIRRLQDHYGGWDNQVRVGVNRARAALARIRGES